jgi:hypothetical protein
MFVYTVDRNNTFLPKAYQHIPITFAPVTVSETVKKNRF